MALIFMDGFDHYTTQTDFWDAAGNDCAIRLNTGQSRTGIGCLQINSGAFGPQRAFAHMTNVLFATGWSSSAYGEIFRFLITDYPGTVVQARVLANADGSVSFARGDNGPVIGTTAPLLVTFGVYNSIAVQIQNFTAAAIITCWVNGVQVFHQTGLALDRFPANPYCNGIQLMAPGGTPTCFHDD